MNNTTKPATQPATQPKLIGKYFRLLDFRVFDCEPTSESDKDGSGSDGSGGGGNNKRKFKKRKPKQFAIQIFCINEQGDTCSITVNDYKPFFYIKVGDNWDPSDVKELRHHLVELPELKMVKSAISTVELVQKHKLYGFSAGKLHNFARITFENQQAMNKVKGLWYTYEKGQRKMRDYLFNGHKLQLYESGIPPLLRYFHIQNISPSGWILLRTNHCEIPAEKQTTCKYEYVCSERAVKPAPEKETRVPYKICSFDIEASSSHGDFPVPVKSYKKLATNIVDIFDKQSRIDEISVSRAETILRRIVMTAFGYDTFDDVDVVYPVDKPTKPQIHGQAEKLVNRVVSKIEVSQGSNAAASSIESMFTKMREMESQHVVDGDEDDFDVDADGVDGDDDEVDADEVDTAGDEYVGEDADEYAAVPAGCEIIDETSNQAHASAFVSKTPVLKVNRRLVDVLIDPETKRDDKMQLTTHILDRLFPKLEGDRVTFIGSTFMRYGDTLPYRNHCIVVGACDPVPNCDIVSVANEYELLTTWTQIMREENPDIVIGYNIFGFDYEFMFRRSQECCCMNEFMRISRNAAELSAIQKKTEDGDEEYDLDGTKVALASGEYELRYPRMTGRLQIDLLTYFRREFNMSSYKLDDVASSIISDSVAKVETCISENVTRLYSKNLAGLGINDFIHIELCGFSSDYYQDGKKFRVANIEFGVELDGKKYNVIVLEGAHLIDAGKRQIKWGMAKDDVSPQDIFRLSNGSAADRAIVAKYCIQDCNLVHHLMNKVDVVTGYVEMARICSVPISFLVLRGQGIKLTSFVAKKCREKNTLMPDLDKTQGQDGYEGAIVLPPKCSMYMDNPVACVDYSSLYPSSMISQNYSHDSKVWTKEYDLDGRLIRTTGERDAKGNYIYDKLPGYEYIVIEFDTYEYRRPAGKPMAAATKTKVGRMVCCWAQLPCGQKSIMPMILEELLKARKDTRKMAQKFEKTDPFMANILDKRQLGYKVTANSLYGQCGAKTSTFYEKDVAACTTATGRMMITYAKRIIEEVYGDMVYETACRGPVKCKAEYVYGDSVSASTLIPIKTSNNTMEHIQIQHLIRNPNMWTTCQEPGKQTKEVWTPNYVMEVWTDKGWTRVQRVIRHLLASHKQMFRITTDAGSVVEVTDDHSLLRPDGTMISPKECCVGTALMARSLDTGGPVKAEYIVSMEPFEYSGYVYDLTTENHHFAAGVGNLIVHNTDSVFFTFNLENPETGEKIRGKPALEMTIEIAQDAAKLCSNYLKAPMELSYEKTLMPFILLSKKRYVGMLYEEDPNKGKLKFMGLVLKRRDNCDLVKDVYGGVLDILMKSTGSSDGLQAAIEFLNKSLNELIDGKVPMEKLMITKALRGYYKNPQQIAHRVLADRIAVRDPGNKPKAGDRMRYVYIQTPTVSASSKAKKLLQGDKIETPEYIVENKLKINYTHYITNQLMKPLQQLFGLALEQIWMLKKKEKTVRDYRRKVAQIEAECDGNLEVFMKKREKCSSAEIKKLLFDDHLTKIYQKNNGIRPITHFWGAK